MPDAIRVVEAGEAALLVILGATVDLELNRRTHRLAAELATERGRMPGLGAPVPAYASVLVPYDPDVVSPAEAGSAVDRAIERALAPSRDRDRSIVEGTLHEVRVRYGGADGPDLETVAGRLGRTPDDVVALHAGTVYTVFLLGFSAGFGYLGILPAELELPRRDVPRPRVPAGSVAIAGRQTAVYPAASPGGWHLLGRTDERLWDPRRHPPASLAPGDRVRFVPA